MINTDKGKIYFKKVKNKLKYTEISIESIANENLIHATPLGIERKHIYEDIIKYGYGTVEKRICKYKYFIPFIKRIVPKKIKKKIKNILRRK